MITVCSLSRLAETVERTGARRLVTLISAGTQVPRPATITAEDHLFLAFNDITAPAEGLTPPGANMSPPSSTSWEPGTGRRLW